MSSNWDCPGKGPTESWWAAYTPSRGVKGVTKYLSKYLKVSITE